MDPVLQQLGIDRIYLSTISPIKVMASWKSFIKYLKPTLKRLCEKDLSNLDKYLNQVLASYRVTSNLATAETPFFLVDGRDLNLTLALNY